MPALAALVLLIVWASDQAGYPVTHWAPGGLIVLALLALTLAIVGLRQNQVPLPVKIALGCLAAYTALSFLSILWAAVPGNAWEGANRTLLYLLVFALFACWRQRGRSAALLLGGWTAAMIGLAAFVALHVNAATSAGLQSMIPGGRLIYPSGYANANAAQWLMAFWPALLLARSGHLPWSVRGAFAGGAVLLAEVALLSQSRGSLFATPVMLLLVFALLPERTRTFALLVPVAAGIGAAAPAVLRVGDNLHNGDVAPATIHSATTATFVAALAVGLVVALGAGIESRHGFSPVSVRRIRRGLGAAAIAALVAVVAGAWVAAGDPVARVRHGWQTFKGGYAANSTTGSRLVRGLGSNRYDFYRVSLNEFVAHPLAGIGADNFQQQYLRHGRSKETPAIRTASSCAHWCRPGCWGRCWRWSAWAPHWPRAPARFASQTRSLARWQRRHWRGSATGWCTAQSTGSGSSPASVLRRLRCSASPARWPREQVRRGPHPHPRRDSSPGRPRPQSPHWTRRPGSDPGAPWGRVEWASAWAYWPGWRPRPR